MFQFQKHYFLLFVFLLAIEVFIGFYVHDSFVRPYVGDFLVVILLYTLFRSLVKLDVLPAAIFVLIFAIAVETAQYFNLVEHLGLNSNKLARIVIGNSFEWSDILAYAAGIIITLLFERRKRV